MFLVALLLGVIATLTQAGQVYHAPIDDYVWKPDAAYGWVDMGEEYILRSSVGKRGYTAHVLNMTSQRWLADADFTADSDSHSLWWHYLVVIVPDEVKYVHNATMWITGGSVRQGPPSTTDEDILLTAALACSAMTVAGALFQIPNEHTTFTADPIKQSRTEDAIIAFTWDHYIKDPSDPTWLVRFPMVKASLRAMDTITEFMKVQYPEVGYDLTHYTVAGASKRGWTTWLVGAVDPERVAAIVPVVLDAINFVAVEHHQYRSYGGWTYALADYTAMNLTERFDDPNMVHLQENVDPYWFKERLTMPKLVVNAGMDEFQQPDDTHYWWSEMPEPKHFMLVPDAEHSLATGILEVVPSISAWIQNLLMKEDIPQFDWKISEETGAITVTLNEVGVVHEASVWYAYSCGVNDWDGGVKRRDFRVAHLDSPCTCGPYVGGMCVNAASLWNKKTLESTMVRGKRTYTAQMDAPEDGRWVAYMVDIKYHNKHWNPWNEGDNVDLANKLNASPRVLSKAAAARASVGYERKSSGIPTDLGRFFEFTSEVSVWPNTFPYPDCSGVACGERLL